MTATDPLATAVATHRVVTTPQPVPALVRPRPRALCGRTGAGGSGLLPSRHADGGLPPPPRLVRPHQWSSE